MMERDTEKTSKDEDRLLLNALADGELDAAATLTLEARIEGDPDLKAECERIIEAKSAMQRLGRPAVSEEFRQRIEAPARPQAENGPPTSRPAYRPANGGWRNMAAAALVGAVLSGGGTYLLTASKPTDTLEAAVTASHMRSLLAASPVDVASSDRHTVKPWLDTKLGVSPPAIDLTDKGFELVGGRVDVIGGRSVPSLVYRHREHLISLIASPAGPDAVATEAVSFDAGGYHMVKWTDKSFSYWAISDLEPSELLELVKLYRAQH
jgi:anti-sigma factor RsiW